MCALARARRFLTNIAIKVEIALITTITTIQSGSCSYIMQSETIGNAVMFSIVTCVCVCVCVCAIYTNSQQLSTIFKYIHMQHFSFRHIRNCQLIYTNSFAMYNHHFTSVDSQLSVCNCHFTGRCNHGCRTSPSSDRMPENLCHPPTNNAYHRMTISKF